MKLEILADDEVGEDVKYSTLRESDVNELCVIGTMELEIFESVDVGEDVEEGKLLESEVNRLVVSCSMEQVVVSDTDDEEREDCLGDKLETSNGEKGEHEL